MRTRWDKMDVDLYKSSTDTKLKALLMQIKDTPSCIIADRIHDILSSCAKNAQPSLTRKQKTKYKWQSNFKSHALSANRTFYALKQVPPEERQNSKEYYAHINAKRNLRKAQRQARAQQRREDQISIIRSCKVGNRENFFKLIKRKRQPPQMANTLDFGKHTEETSEGDSWANYFEDLATPKNDSSFDKEYHRHLQTTYLLQSITNRNEAVGITVSDKDIREHIANLKNGKASDIHGISSEHLKLASPIIVPILTQLVNQILQCGKLPPTYKEGIITPVLKTGKPAKQPNSYRRITITSIVGKIVEKHLLKQIRPVLDSAQSRSQFGFTKGNSPTYAALIITELLAEAKDTKSELHITFMDTSKAFDVVDRKGMLNALHYQGIHGSLWNLLDDMYSSVIFYVKWKNIRSKPIDEQQGIRQGGDSSADCYKAGKTKLLHHLDRNPSAKIGSINAGAVMVAPPQNISCKSRLTLQKWTPHVNATSLTPRRQRLSV